MLLLGQRPRRLAAHRVDGYGLRARRRRDGHRVPLSLAPGAHRALAARGVAGDDLVVDRAGRLRRHSTCALPGTLGSSPGPVICARTVSERPGWTRTGGFTAKLNGCSTGACCGGLKLMANQVVGLPSPP